MNIAVIFAGGVGRRMNNGAFPKQFLKINGKPVIAHTLDIFEESENIDKIIVVMVKSHLKTMQKIVNQYRYSKIDAIVPGGETGQLSIYNGLKAADEITTDEEKIVLIHDGVRPFIDDDLIKRNIESVKKYGNAISSVPQKETTVIVNSHGMINETTNRNMTYIARAPQSFYLKDILNAHNKCLEQNEINMTDSCTMMLSFGEKLHIVESNSDNIKITTPDDYYIAKALIDAKEHSEIFG